MLSATTVSCFLGADLGANLASQENGGDSTSVSQYSTVESRKSHSASAATGITRDQVLASLNTHMRKELKELVEENQK